MTHKSRVLLIDDSEGMVEFWKNFLSKRYDVVTAYNGIDGLKEFEGKPFDLVITDLVMPVLSGIGVISAVKQMSPQTPVIAITGWGEHPCDLAAEAKADMVLNKPFEPVELERCISKLLIIKAAV